MFRPNYFHENMLKNTINQISVLNVYREQDQFTLVVIYSDTVCSLNIVFFFPKNFQYFVISPLPALRCYWLYRKWPANRSDCTLRSDELLSFKKGIWLAVNLERTQFLMNTLYFQLRNGKNIRVLLELCNESFYQWFDQKQHLA